jgi:hypothetical protein
VLMVALTSSLVGNQPTVCFCALIRKIVVPRYHRERRRVLVN